jgi:lipoprotein-releasing system permease protein
VRYERFIGLRHLGSHRVSFLNILTTIAVVGVALSVAMFVAMVSISGGFVDAFRDRVLGVNAHVTVMKSGVFFADYRRVVDELDAIEGVELASPFIIREMLVTSATSRARPGALIKGIDAELLAQNEDLAEMVVEGDLAGLTYVEGLQSDTNADGTPAGIAVGRVLAERLQAEIGDTLTLVSPLRGVRSLGANASDGGANYARVTLAAIVDTGFYDYDNRLILMDVHGVQELLGLGDTVMGIELRLDDGDATDRVKAEVEERLAASRFRIYDWREINRNLFRSLALQRLVMTLIVVFMVIVASTVIFCVLIMMVLERRREIAVLRSMGATAGGVMRIFVVQGMAIGVIGTSIGLLLGVLVCHLIGAIDFGLEYEVYRIPSLPVTLRAHELALAAGGTLLQCFLATLYPSLRAAKVAPADALRYD